ncbi:MAG: phage protease [Bilophila sp.]
MDMEKWIEIARTGTFTDSQGRPQTFTTSDLDAIVSSYDPATLEAPLVFGHPKDSDPAFGWVQSLRREGEKLFAQFAQVPDTVRRLVDDGRYRYVSMSLMPDRKRLRHVGLLGAAVPAIEGLGPVELTSDNDAICIDFGELQPKEPGMATLEELQAEIAKLTAERDGAKNDKDESEKKAAETAAEFAAYKSGVTVKAREARLDALVKAGKVKPAERSSVLSFAAALADVEKPVEFAAADGKTESVTAEERYFRELAARAPSGLDVDFSAFAAPGHVTQSPIFSAADVTAKL